MTTAKRHDNNLTYYDSNEERHRIDGPARIWDNGISSWWLHGLRHRVGGPAVETANGKKWWLSGVNYTEREYWCALWDSCYEVTTSASWLSAYSAWSPQRCL